MESSKKKAFAILFLCVATELIGFGLIVPFLPQLAHRLQVSSLMLGVLMAAFSAAQFFAAPILGSLSDRYGRKPILVISKIGTCIGYLILAFSHQYGWFLVSRLVDGFTGGNISVARAYMADITTPEERPRGMAMIGIAFGVGFLLGPALGAFLYALGDGQFWPGIVASGLSATAVLFTMLFLPEPGARTVSGSALNHFTSGFRFLRNPAILTICLFQMVYMTLFSGFESTFSVFTHLTFGFNESQNGWLFVLAGLITLVVQGSISRWRKSSPMNALGVGAVALAISFAILSMVNSIGVMGVALTALALGSGLIGAFLPALLSIRTSADIQGRVMGLFEGFGSLSRVLGPLVGFAFFAVQPSFCYAAFSGILALSTVTFFIVMLRFSPK